MMCISPCPQYLTNLYHVYYVWISVNKWFDFVFLLRKLPEGRDKQQTIRAWKRNKLVAEEYIAYFKKSSCSF